MFKLYSLVWAITAGFVIAYVQSPLEDDNDPCTVDYTSVAGQGSNPAWLISSNGGGGNRSFLVNVPASYKFGEPMGMIISYHGRGKNMAEQEGLSQFSDESFKPQFIAVYPQGNHNNWQGAPYHDPSISDIQFTSDLLTYMRNNYCIDDNRIYANGKSNGGGFVGTLACDPLGSNFAAFAPVSGALYTDIDDSSPCHPNRNVTPILEFHGFMDDIIPYGGGLTDHGTGSLVGSIPSWLQRWAGRNGCSGNPPSNTTTIIPYTQTKTVYYSTFDCGTGKDNIVQGYNISNLRHVWPSMHANDDNGGKSSQFSPIEATRIILDFFAGHSLS